MLQWDMTLGLQLTNLISAVLLPISDVWSYGCAKRPTSPDGRSDSAIKSSFDQAECKPLAKLLYCEHIPCNSHFLGRLRGTRFDRSDESRSNPDGGGTVHQRCGDASTCDQELGHRQYDES